MAHAATVNSAEATTGVYAFRCIGSLFSNIHVNRDKYNEDIPKYIAASNANGLKEPRSSTAERKKGHEKKKAPVSYFECPKKSGTFGGTS